MSLSKAVLGSLLAIPALAARGQEDARELARLPFEGRYTSAGSLALVDLGCILRTWRLKGILACPNPQGGVKVCLWVENAWPSGILEVVRQPRKSHYSEMKGILEGAGRLALGAGSSDHGPRAGDGTALQFGEGRAYIYVPEFGLGKGDLPLAVPPERTWTPSYVSELDALGWRSPAIDTLTAPEALIGKVKSCSIPDPWLCAGTWGSYFPRIGFLNHPSEPMAAFVQALRAGRVASRPLGRTALEIYPYEPRTGHYVQMVEPIRRSCISIGSPRVREIETGAGSKHGNYLFVHFGVFEVCRGCLPVRLTGARAPI